MVFRIREAREAAGMTQAELASKLGINNVTLSGYETGKHDPKSVTLTEIARICNTTTDFLLGRDVEQSKPASDILYTSYLSGNTTVDEYRRILHEYIDSLTDEEVRSMAITFKLVRPE